jgi:hypothetical protein
MGKVTMKNVKTLEERTGFEGEDGCVRDSKGNEFDKYWAVYDFSPGFKISALFVLIVIISGIFLIITGQAK